MSNSTDMPNGGAPDCPTPIPSNKPARSITISKKAVIVGVVVVLTLFITAYILTFIIDKGTFQRTADGAIIVGTYTADNSLQGITWWQFLLAPVLILAPSSAGAGTVWAILILLFVIGAIFTALDASGVLVYMVEFLNDRFKKSKYLLLFILSFVFMFLGSTAGMFEELIPLVPVVIMLCYALGWDALTGLGISVLSTCMGFAAGVINPFTVGVAQKLGEAYGIVMYSGIGLRLLAFVGCYILLMIFLYPYAKRIEKNPSLSPVYKEDKKRCAEFNFNLNAFVPDKKKNKALTVFGCALLSIIAFALLAIALQEFAHFGGLTDYIMYYVMVAYFAAGLIACKLCGMSWKNILKNLGKGMVTLLPAIVLILFAGGIRYVVEKGLIMDTILFNFTKLIQGSGQFSSTLVMYAIIWIFQIFIQSGSAKALLLMPMIYDLCELAAINPNIAVLGFAFADGFTNVILPTNAGLLLILGLTTVDYGKWFKWSIKIQLCLLAMSISVLGISHFLVYPATPQLLGGLLSVLGLVLTIAVPLTIQLILYKVRKNKTLPTADQPDESLSDCIGSAETNDTELSAQALPELSAENVLENDTDSCDSIAETETTSD